MKYYRRFSAFLIFMLLINFLSAEIRYIEIDSINDAPIVEIKNIDDFEAVITNYGVRLGYLQKSSSTSMLYVIGDGVYFCFPMKGYNKLSDYKTGEVLKFKNGNDFNKAMVLGFESSESFYYYTANNFNTVEDCKDALRNGFSDVRIDYSARYPIVNSKQQSASDAYYAAKKLGYTKYADYKEYLDFMQKGFESKIDFLTGTAKGFKNGNDYYDAKQRGFDNYVEYRTAQDFGLIEYSDYQNFSKIIQTCEKLVEEKKIDRKNALVLYYIQNLQKGEMSLSILSNTIKSDFNNQSKELCNAINLWGCDYSGVQEFNSQRDNRHSYYSQPQKRLINFSNYFSTSILSDFFSNVDTSSLGSYNTKTDIFKKK